MPALRPAAHRLVRSRGQKAATCTSRQTTKASYPKTSHQASVFSRRPSPSEKLARPSPQRNSHCRRRPCPRVKEATKKRGSRKRHLSRPSPRRPSVRRLRARPWRRLGRRHRPTDVLRTSPAPPRESNSGRKTAVSARRPMAGPQQRLDAFGFYLVGLFPRIPLAANSRRA